MTSRTSLLHGWLQSGNEFSIILIVHYAGHVCGVHCARRSNPLLVPIQNKKAKKQRQRSA